VLAILFLGEGKENGGFFPEGLTKMSTGMMSVHAAVLV
jgi:hypothetical protein